MRLWHPDLICAIDRKRLLAQHREVHGLYTIASEHRNAYRHHPLVMEFLQSPRWLASYHYFVSKEMIKRGYSHESELVYSGYGFVVSPPMIESIYPPPGNPYRKNLPIEYQALCPGEDVIRKWEYGFWFRQDCLRLDEKCAWISFEVKSALLKKLGLCQ